MIIRTLLIGLLTLSGAVHAAQPVNPPGLLPSEIAGPLLEQDPGVATARAGLEVARQEAAILDKSPYEWTARATGQQRRLDSGPAITNGTSVSSGPFGCPVKLRPIAASARQPSKSPGRVMAKRCCKRRVN